MEEKKKSTTSTEVKMRYIRKTYGMLSIRLPKDKVSAFKKKCAETGVPQARIISKAIDDFLEEGGKS